MLRIVSDLVGNIRLGWWDSKTKRSGCMYYHLCLARRAAQCKVLLGKLGNGLIQILASNYLKKFKIPAAKSKTNGSINRVCLITAYQPSEIVLNLPHRSNDKFKQLFLNVQDASNSASAGMLPLILLIWNLCSFFQVVCCDFLSCLV